MLDGWLALGLDPGRVTVIDPQPSADLAARAREHGFPLRPRADGVAPPAVLVLAVKPQTLEGAGPGLSGLVGPEALVVSVLAGKTVADLRRALPGARAVVRAMPNLPAAIRRGATGAYAGPTVDERGRRYAHAVLSAVGLVEWIDREELIDAVTALSGSGPAYLFHLAECLAEAGAAAGLEPALADRLARATLVGAAALMDETGEAPARLRENVTSPGGTTAAALDVLRGERGLAPLMRDAVLAAKRRAAELAG